MNETGMVAALIKRILLVALTLACAGTIAENLSSLRHKTRSAEKVDAISYGKWNRSLLKNRN